jgi:hypothetical protein
MKLLEAKSAKIFAYRQLSKTCFAEITFKMSIEFFSQRIAKKQKIASVIGYKFAT